MADIDVRSLIFDPDRLWLGLEPRVYFNSEILRFNPHNFHRGIDTLKVLVEAPAQDWRLPYEDLRMSIYHVGADQPLQPVLVRPLRILEERGFRRGSYSVGMVLDTIEETGLIPGSYLARVEDGMAQSEVVVGEHRFHVLGVEEYDDFWLKLFGTDWDEPVFWDSVEVDQAAELVHGLPIEGLLEFLGDVTWDGSTIYQLLGPLITTCMIGDVGHLPFGVTYTGASSPPPSLPHINLTKLMWVLRVLGPVWADAAFFSPSFDLGYEVQDYHSIRIDFRYLDQAAYSLYEEGVPEASRARPRLFDLVQRTFRGKLTIDTGSEERTFRQVSITYSEDRIG